MRNSPTCRRALSAFIALLVIAVVGACGQDPSNPPAGATGTKDPRADATTTTDDEPGSAQSAEPEATPTEPRSPALPAIEPGAWDFIPGSFEDQPAKRVACGGVSFCLGSEASGLVRRFNGTEWETAGGFLSGIQPGPLSCGGPDFCVTTGDGKWSVTNDQGQTYREGGELPAAEFRAIQCFSSKECSGSANEGVYWLSNDTWERIGDFPKELSFVQDGQRFLGGAVVVCTSRTQCFGLDKTNESNIFSYDGSSWKLAFKAPTFLTHITCPRVDFCMALGPATFFISNGETWEEADSPQPAESPGDVSCADDGTCLLIDQANSFWTYKPANAG